MFRTACHCGNIGITTKSPPVSITRCNCSICHRLGALWAYYKSNLVDVKMGKASADIYSWAEKTITYHRCADCGCTTHYTVGEGEQAITAINCRMADATSLEGIRIRQFDGLLTWKYLD